MCSCRHSVCPHFIHLFLFCMHTCKYSEYAESKKRFRHSTGLFSLLPAQFAVFGLGFIELALYTWLTPSSSSATITPRCQEVPVLSAQALPALRRTSTASDWFLVRRCDVRGFFSSSFIWRRKNATSTSRSIVNIALFPESSPARWHVLRTAVYHFAIPHMPFTSSDDLAVSRQK